MIYDVLEVFRKEYEAKGDKLILDNYQLKDGLYVRVNENESLDYFIFANDKKQENKENCFKDLDGNIQKNEYAWFKEKDYYSGYLNSNKSFYDKKIHNINYLSFFVKVESFNENSDKKINLSSIKGQYLALLNYKKFTKPKEKEVIKNYNDYLNGCSRKKDVVKKYRFIETHIHPIIEIAQNNGVVNYVKIFFDADIETYKKESEIYYSIKIFNDIGYSKKIDEVVYGLSDSNMGLNSKKPFLEHKTRKIESPFMLLDSDALLVKKFFDWLKLQDGKEKFPIGEQFFIHRDFKEKDLIQDFDYIPHKIEKLQKAITVKNYLNIKDKTDFEVYELWQLENTIDETFYNKQLKFNYFRDDLKVSDFVSKKLQQLIFETKYAMVNYFKKFDEREFYQVVKKYGSDFVVEHLRQNREYKAKESLNLKFSLLQHKGEKVMDIKSMQERMIQKLETSDYDSLKSEEFFYLCGQVVSYLLSKKNQHEKMHDLVEPFLRANNAQKLKKEIEFAFFQYKHAIYLGAKKINSAIALIEAYEGEEKLSYFMDSFLVGYLSNTYIFKSSEGELK